MILCMIAICIKVSPTAALSEKRHTDLKQFFYLRCLFLILQEQDQMIIRFDHDVMVRHQHFITSDDGTERRAFRKFYLVESPTDHL